MPYVIAEPCIDVRDRACVDECPVDCIYEGGRSLYIHPDECIDCGACEPVCPVQAIFYQDDLPAEWAEYQADNERFFSTTLPGRNAPLGAPGGAAKVGPTGVDTPLVAGFGAMDSDLIDRDDVRLLVEEFYRTAFRDPLIGPIFTDIARMDLDHHLPIMCDFWETVLFQAGLYRRNALQLHLALNAKFPLQREHFDRWLQIWKATVDAHFAGEKAELAKTQAGRIAGSIRRRVLGRSGSEFETLHQRSREG